MDFAFWAGSDDDLAQRHGVGFFIGLLVGLVAGVSFWFFGLPYILGVGPSV